MNERQYRVRPHAFTLVELALALAVVALGLLSVLGLVSAGVQTGGEALDGNYVANAMQQFGEYIGPQLRQDWDTTVDPVEGTATLPVRSGGTYNLDADQDSLNDTGWAAIPNSDLLRHRTRYGLYRYNAGGRLVSLRAWQESVAVAVMGPARSNDVQDVPSSRAVRVSAELSWPVASRYGLRHKRYLHLTVRRPAGED